MKKIAIPLSLVLSAGFVGCNHVTFNPEGTWDFVYGKLQASATYVNSEFNATADASFEDFTGMPDPGVIDTLPLTYNPSTHEVSGIGGMPVVVENGIGVIGSTETSTPAPGFNCTVTQYEKQLLEFNGAGSHVAVRQVFGIELKDTSSINNCTAALAPAKASILSGSLPSGEISYGIFLGVLKAVVFDQLRTYEFSFAYEGTKTSASESLDGAISFEIQQPDLSAVKAQVDAVAQTILGNPGI
jgi:hypothetical protein